MSLDSLVNAATGDELKFIFVGGKGGVGKTTSSSAIASLLATSCQKRVLLISTDPAHSLGDAWGMSFSNTPTSPTPNLDVMEVDPKDTMDGELQKWMSYSNDILGDAEGSSLDGDNELVSKINSFREWLSGIPGIDEATALSSAIHHIESGKYDIIVFDTAPTGHTLKLLALPDILEKGIDKLQSWQGTLWGYWETFKGLTRGGGTAAAKKRGAARDEMAKKLEEYKRGVQKVACMLQDQTRTRFVVICIAEYLSVSETRRLLAELDKNKVRASHVVVNQLVVGDALDDEELGELEQLAEVGGLQLNQELLKKTVQSCRLTSSRRKIQNKYLAELKAYPEAQGLEGVVQVPLLPQEVRGVSAMETFSKLLVTDEVSIMNEDGVVASHAQPVALYDEEIARKNHTYIGTKDTPSKSKENITFSLGDVVKVVNLAKAAHFNGLQGKIISDKDIDTGRYGVAVNYDGKRKSIALQPKNMLLVEPGNKKQKVTSSSTDREEKKEAVISDSIMNKAKKVLEDPEIKEMVAQNPRVKDAIEDCMQNPMNFMKYISDPELSPFLSKAMSKMR
mmetsp:Transcript_53785/g.64895  ORF Transcript_53785/g.64895 Transcript_53785/m.64895 type:complete len:565 (-) Transcript_53785:472-2166(-)|eukprot:CAMPEP_0172494974 /NCGR_PEP_ID=MMETSP1066-20121228/60352_1 /TAXON_ID=671091 /ORGANISM="Coscinodiscus wailesii, Strain CCMP2513" /LENGTH=564 /DNA_ID=CAMNT_0013266347 /DNA_START=160 /DNA_END=1854 /DNA_ORIENTATION=+